MVAEPAGRRSFDSALTRFAQDDTPGDTEGNVQKDVLRRKSEPHCEHRYARFRSGISGDRHSERSEESLYFSRSTVDTTGKIQGSVRSAQDDGHSNDYSFAGNALKQPTHSSCVCGILHCALGISQRRVISTGAGRLSRPEKRRNPRISGCGSE